MKILISGSSSGIGKAITEKMLASNHSVIGLARNHEKFSPQTDQYYTYSMDFSRIANLEKEFRAIHQDHPHIDMIICCAGYGEFCEFEQFSVTKMQNLMNVNFMSQAVLVKTFLPSLKKQKSGKIIFIGSECSLEGQKKGSMYCASKFALRGFAQSLRKECASANICVTLVNPGFVDTPFFNELTFRPAPGLEHAIQSEQIALLISTLVNEKNNCVFEEINLQPMKKVIEKNN